MSFSLAVGLSAEDCAPLRNAAAENKTGDFKDALAKYEEAKKLP